MLERLHTLVSQKMERLRKAEEKPKAEEIGGDCWTINPGSEKELEGQRLIAVASVGRLEVLTRLLDDGKTRDSSMHFESFRVILTSNS